MPDVPPPDDAPEWRPRTPFPIPRDVPSWLTITDLRDAPSPGRGQAMWARMREMRQTRSTLGFLADMVPAAVINAAGRQGGGTSLDNAMRFGPPPETEWILVDFDPYIASGGYVHGAARLWSSDGVLLGVASQTASVFLF
jgi:acyl-CoA thioesterase